MRILKLQSSAVECEAKRLPDVGVGLTFMPALASFYQENKDLIDVIEVEPQSMWMDTRPTKGCFSILDGVIEEICSLPFNKLVHSVAAPVGGSVEPSPAILELLAENIAQLDSPWVSEHLAFNHTQDFHTAFFLPPCQVKDGIDQAVASIQLIRNACGVPVAVETGVNYLKPRKEEIPDSEFLKEIVNKSGCGILLDLHNIYCNQLNGRESIDSFLKGIPLEQVWEVHLAGGISRDGYWLDAHSGEVPQPLLKLCREIIPKLPNLKGLIFELFPSFIPVVGTETIRQQLVEMQSLWQLRKNAPCQIELSRDISRNPPVSTAVSTLRSPSMSVIEWEDALGALVIGRSSPHKSLSSELREDPAIKLVNGLIGEFRGSMIVGTLQLTSTLLALTLGPTGFSTILKDFWSKMPPSQYPTAEAQQFGVYMHELDLNIPHLSKVIEFELSAIRCLHTSSEQLLRFDFDPLPLLRALAEGKLPDVLGEAGSYEILLTPEDISNNSEGGSLHWRHWH